MMKMNRKLSPELRQVLTGLALNRTPGWNFPGNFLELSFDDVLADTARVSIVPGPHCTGTDGQSSFAALAVLADIGMAAAMRQEIGFSGRMATVSMTLQLTGAPLTGRLEAHGRMEGFLAGAATRQGMTRADIYAGGTLACCVSGSFIALGNKAGTAAMPMRKRGREAAVPPLEIAELTDEEKVVFDRASAAMDSGPLTFIDRFWGLLPVRNDGGASCDFPNGLHVGNRVGHTQGGVMLALAASTADAALDDGWHLAGVSSWYITPGTGAALRAEASIVHQGSRTAVVRSRVIDGQGKTVVESVTSHARAAR